MRIGLDFDDVVVGTTEYKVKYFERRFGITRHIVTRDTFVHTGDISEDIYKQAMREMYADLEASIEHLQQRDNCAEHILSLQDKGHEFAIITARDNHALAVARHLLTLWGLPHIPTVGVGYANSKRDAASELGITVYIDDEPKNLIPLADVVPYRFLMTQAENLDFVDNTITRVNNWQEFANIINLLQ